MLWARFLAQRLVALVVVVFGIAVITFFAARVLPGDPAVLLAGIGATTADIASVRHRLGLDRPLWVQFYDYLDGLLHFNFGTSLSNEQPVTGQILSRLPATLELAALAVILYVLLSVLFGIMSANVRRPLQANVVRVASTAMSAVPPYWLALILQLVFYYWLGWFPSGGRLPLSSQPPPDITGFYLLDSLLSGNLRLFWLTLYYLLLPTTSLMLGNIGTLTRMTRTQVIDERGKGYVTTAQAKGLSNWRVETRHVLPNALNPLITVVGMQVGFLIAGTIFVEQIFAWPGLGSYTWTAITNEDYPVICGVVVTLSIVFVLTSFVIDIVHRLIDPRIGFRS